MKIHSFYVFVTLILMLNSKLGFSLGSGFAWNDKATFSGTRNLSGQYNFNSTGSSLEITYKSTGLYTVSFEGLGNFSYHGGHVQVTSYGSNKTHCKVESWNRFRKMRVTVACYNTHGEKTDSQFTISVRNPEESEPSYAYTYADEENEAEYTPESKYTSTPGGSVLIKKTGRGSYTTTFSGLSAYLFKGGNVQVTAVGRNSHSCQVKSWHKVGTDIQVHVKCFSVSGAEVNTPFLVHMTTQNFHGDDRMKAAYAWTSKATLPYYEAHHHYSQPTASVSRHSQGVYTLKFQDITSFSKSNVQISTYGSSFAHCKVRYWTHRESQASIIVHCFNQNGAPVDSKLSARLAYW